MKAQELEIRVLARVQDDSFAGVVLDLFNICRGELAGEIDLPALHRVTAVAATANAGSVALPADYGQGLYWVTSAAQGRRVGRRKADYHNLAAFLAKHPTNQAGQITDVVIQGSELLYQGSTADTLTLRYYAKPAPIGDRDEPTEIPGHLQAALLVNYACREIYDVIEDGIEGNRANFNHYDRAFQSARFALAAWAEKQKPREPVYVEDVNGY